MQETPKTIDDAPSFDAIPMMDPIIWIADLDPEGVLVGFKQCLRSEKPADAVEVPVNCDLAVDGRYRFDREQGAFIPRPEILGRVAERAYARQLAGEAIAGLRSPDSLPALARAKYDQMTR